MFTFLVVLLVIGICSIIYIASKNESFKSQLISNLSGSSNKVSSTANIEFQKVINELLDDRCVILDTETTGLTDTAEIVEISLIDSKGNVLLDTLVKPKRKMRADNKAIAIHGITNEMLENAPKWDELHETFCNLISGKRVVVYNANYDLRVLNQTAEKYGLGIPDFRPECAMMIYGVWEGTKSEYGKGYKYHKLENAARKVGIKVNGQSHRALTDCLTTLGVLQKLRDAPLPPR